MFRTSYGEDIFKSKYAQNQYETWADRTKRVVNWVCGDMDGTKNHLLSKDDQAQLIQFITEFKFMPGGRYLWYGGREARFFNNCYLLRLEDDTREEWAALSQRAMSCLMTGGGIGADVSLCRPGGRALRRTGGVSSGPLPLLSTLNEIGRNVMQGGSRRSALYGSLSASHGDIWEFLHYKNWHDRKIAGSDMTVADAKKEDFNYPAPLDMMNISTNYSDEWLNGNDNEVFMENSGFADFQAALLPLGNGTITGVLTRNQNNYILTVRDLEDVKMNNVRCGGIEYYCETPVANTTIQSIKEMYKETSITLKVPLVIKVVITANDSSGNFYKEIYVQDESGGINIKIEEIALFETFQLNHEITIAVNGITLHKVDGEFVLGVLKDDAFSGIQEEDFYRFFYLGEEAQHITPKAIEINAISEKEREEDNVPIAASTSEPKLKTKSDVAIETSPVEVKSEPNNESPEKPVSDYDDFLEFIEIKT